MLKSREFTVCHFCRAKSLKLFISFYAVELIPNDSKYLNYSSQKRYLVKLKINGQVLQDRYHIDQVHWSEDMTKWPELQFGNVYTYKHWRSIYIEKLKVYKSLEACKYFYNDCVYCVLVVILEILVYYKSLS